MKNTRRPGRLALWLSRIPVRHKLTLVVMVFVAVIGVLLVLGYFAMEVLSTVRAYVGGEGLYSKSQKAASYQLLKYAHFHDERDYEKYLRFISVPLGDRDARLELERPSPDFAVVDEALIRGRNHPDEVRAVGLFFKRFRHVGYVDRAITIWAQADALVAELQRAAEDLHAAVSAGRTSRVEIEPVIERLDRIDADLTLLEDRFSSTLGEAARWLKGVLLAAMVGTACLFLGLGIYVNAIISRGIVDGVSRLQDGTARIGRGDFSERIEVAAGDEFGELSSAFNSMSDRLVEASSMRRQAEEQLADRARELADLIENARDLIFAFGPDGKVRRANHAVAREFGCAPEALAGRSVLHLLAPASGERLAELARRLEREETAPDVVEIEIARPDGTAAPFEATLRPVLEGGALKEIQCIARSVADRRDLERRRVEEARLQTAVELAAAAAHELFQPLTAIAGYADLVVAGVPPPPEEARAMVGEIRNQARRMTNIVQRMRDLTQYRTVAYVGETRIADLGPGTPGP